MMSSHLALPHQCHIEEIYHIFAYLKKHLNTEMIFDLTPLDFDWIQFKRQYWSYSAYGHEDTKEEPPKGMPMPYRPGFTM